MMLTNQEKHRFTTSDMKPYLILLFSFILISGCSILTPPLAAPPFILDLYHTTDHNKNDVFNIEQPKGVPTVINFWFPSCPPCVAEMPEINKFYSQHKNDVTVVAIQLIGLDSVEDGEKFVEEKGIHFAVGPDSTGKISVDYQISVYPTTIFVDSDGNIADYWQGEINAEEIEGKFVAIKKPED